MIEKLPLLWPEIFLFLGTCLVMVVGLSPSAVLRQLCGPITMLSLAVAGVAAQLAPTPEQALLPGLAPYAKSMIAVVGLVLCMLASGTVDREEESAIARGAKFNPLRLNRAEFYAFFLFSLTGLMLCATADTLIWLFLALELTSLPTYVMVTISTRENRSQEAGVKYFFLGALGAAIFLYGFTLIYGGTGTTRFYEIRETLQSGGLNELTLLGVILSIVGIGFKIAAVPMHFYTADVYQGSASPISAFLAFVPKTAGFLALLLVVGSVGWDWGAGGLPDTVRMVLWVLAALTMTVGNVLAWLQTSVKRILAYSSIAHSGYMLVGVIAGPGENTFWSSGVSAVLFYLLVYGLTNAGAFAAIASLERRNDDGTVREIDSIEDAKGLCSTHPAQGWMLALCAASLLGVPPLLGFFAKLPLFAAGVHAGEIPLVVVLGVNSAIAAFYYLRLIKAPLLEEPDAGAEPMERSPFLGRTVAGLVSAACVVVPLVIANNLMSAASKAGDMEAVEPIEHHADAGTLASPDVPDAPPEH